jgi:hypothetical protein
MLLDLILFPLSKFEITPWEIRNCYYEMHTIRDGVVWKDITCD